MTGGSVIVLFDSWKLNQVEPPLQDCIKRNIGLIQYLEGSGLPSKFPLFENLYAYRVDLLEGLRV